MDYKRHYDSLISKAKNREICDTTYYEKHHIIPKCVGGDDHSSNILALLPEEHYVAHLLLAKIHKDNGKLWMACVMMSSGLPGRSNKLYAWVRKKHSIYLSLAVKDRWAQKYGFTNYADQCRVIWNGYVEGGLTTKQLQSLYGMGLANINQSLNEYASVFGKGQTLRRQRTNNKALKMSTARQNFTEEQELNRRTARAAAGYAGHQRGSARSGQNNPVYGKRWKYPILVCPHCMKETASKRWHFNNCKERK